MKLFFWLSISWALILVPSMLQKFVWLRNALKIQTDLPAFYPLTPSSVFLFVFLFKSLFLRVLCSQKWDLLMIFLLVWIWQAFCKSSEFGRHSAEVLFFCLFFIFQYLPVIVSLLYYLFLFLYFTDTGVPTCIYLYFLFNSMLNPLEGFSFRVAEERSFDWAMLIIYFFLLFIHYFIHFIPGFKWKLYKLCLLSCNAGEIKPTVNT